MKETIMTLHSEATGNLAKPIGEIAKNAYVIPLYQRSFAWGETEIQQLIQDVYESKVKDSDGSYFIGSLILFRRSDGRFEVIDGQQRLTVISLLIKYLFPSEYGKSFLSYDSREGVNQFLETYYELEDPTSIDERYDQGMVPGTVRDFLAAVSYIHEAPLTPNKDNPILLKDLSVEEIEEFSTFFRDHVKMVEVIMPSSTDVASYFEIMNNRGVQLQHHEVLKSLLMARIQYDSPDATHLIQKSFAEIWDACAEMDMPVQRAISSKNRALLFGQEYDQFEPDNIEAMNITPEITESQKQTISFILSNPDISSSQISENEEAKGTEKGFKAIIDFPNFLMHVLKLDYDDIYRSAKIKAGDSSSDMDGDPSGIPLNEKYLLDVYDTIEEKVDPVSFIKSLLHYRVVFDKYVIRSTGGEGNGNDDDDEFKWVLRRVKRTSNKGYDRVDQSSNTFPNDVQPYIVKAISMLQVTHRQRRYKSFLNAILSWFRNEDAMDGASYLDNLNRLILNEFERNEIYLSLKEGIEYDGESLTLGTSTPHFLFNFLDYLYWTAWKKKLGEYEEVKYMMDHHMKDFDYMYWNSVEHHMPQSFEKTHGKGRKMINSLGNLCLISKAMNSRLNAEEPVGKARNYYKDGFAPLRWIIYNITKDAGEWDEHQIRTHYNNILLMLKDRSHILGLDSLILTDIEVIRAMFCIKDISIHDGSFQSGERRNFKTGASEAKDIANMLITWKVENPSRTWKEFIDEKLKDPACFKDSDGEDEEWRKVFVKYPYLLEYCELGNFGWEKNGKYISMIYQVRYGRWVVKEMRSFIIGRMLSNYRAGVYADGVYIPVQIAERPGPELHIWLDPNIIDWRYEIRLPAGVQKERDILKEKGWVKNNNGGYYNPSQPLLIQDKGYGIEESINLAYEAIIRLLKKI